MSEGQGGASAPAARSIIRSPKDFWGGLSLVLLAAFALWAASDLPGMRGFAFGPGTAPRLFAYSLMALGVGVMLVGLLTDGEPLERFTFSGTFGGAALVISLIPIYFFASRIGKMVPGVPPDIVVAAVGATTVVVLAFVLTNVAPRGPLFITAATIIFASYVSLVIAANATKEVRWIETMIWCAVLTAFCSLLFPYGLNLPLQLWPRF
jgi:putative tricarboxylic transport membrane protein